MVDIHTHVLPEVDDGSKSLEQSLNIIKKEISFGVTDIIATPHYRNGFKADKKTLFDKLALLKSAVKKEGLDINLYLGQEILVTDSLKKKLQNDLLLTMNGSKFILLEFDTQKTCEITEVVYETVRLGYKPIVAHLERYNYATLYEASEIKRLGGFIQVNAGSLFKLFTPFRKKINQFLKEGFVDFVASDTHYSRTNKLLDAYKVIKRKYGEEFAKKIFEENAKELLIKGN